MTAVDNNRQLSKCREPGGPGRHQGIDTRLLIKGLGILIVRFEKSTDFIFFLGLRLDGATVASLAGVLVIGIGIGSAVTSTTQGDQGTIASSQQLDMAVPDPAPNKKADPRAIASATLIGLNCDIHFC